MNIPEHRKAIDKLDAQIVKLLNERTKHVLRIGELKLSPGRGPLTLRATEIPGKGVIDVRAMVLTLLE